ncbi:MAG TPA: type II toxin-antitoxin system VapC family toxin [Gemmataceae bacterium]|nr:type II toxin-antitoxin system VapC family toxin [Gemmataceae bacterium]
MILLDTDTFTLHHAGHLKVVERASKAAEASRLTIVTQVEALRGRQEAFIKAEDGERLLRAQRLLLSTVEHLARFPIVPFDDTAAAEFDRLRQVKGLKKIGRNDLLIASIALANRAKRVTRNTKDFSKVPGLQIENWAD